MTDIVVQFSVLWMITALKMTQLYDKPFMLATVLKLNRQDKKKEKEEETEKQWQSCYLL